MSDYSWGSPPVHDGIWAFEGQCRRFRASLYMRALRLTRNPADAEDLVQASLVKAWVKYETFSQERSFMSWMAAIMLRTFLDRRRADGRRIQPSSLDVLVGNEEDDPMDKVRPVGGMNSEAELIERLARQELIKALQELRPTHQRAILLHEVHGLSYEECARVEGVAVGTVRSRLFRARAQMRKSLQAKLR
ncbi:MAG: RNA polymerase sigma factor [Fimbriimonas sp.]